MTFRPSTSTPGQWAIALAGAVALAVAMGIGRFAFTPLLPMMLHDGVIDLHAASWLASANYLGYLAGALLCTFQPWVWSRVPGLPALNVPWMLRAGLVATGLLTLGMALPVPSGWPVLRFAAGVASAVVFVYTSGFCLAQLAQRGAAALGGAMYAGPGVGIVLTGVFVGAMVHWQWRAATGWLIFGGLAFALTAAVWRTFRAAPPAPAGAPGSAAPAGAPGSAAPAVAPGSAAPERVPGSAAPASAAAAPPTGRFEIAWLGLAYGLAGFGYIVTATFLPVIARAALPGSPWLDLFWPVFGIGVCCGALLTTRLRMSGDMRRLLATSYFVQAAGIALSLWSPSHAGFAFGSLLLGLPFTAITFFTMHEIRRLRPQHAASFMGLLTAMYGLGQIVGPPLVALLLRRSADAGAGFTLSLEIAAGALVVGGLVFAAMARAYPMRRP